MLAESSPRDVGPGDPATVDDYLAFEASAEGKHGLIDGVIVAMSGASLAHNRIVGDVATALIQQLRGGPCEAFVSDLRVKVEALDQYTYPDVVVACGEPTFDTEAFDTLLDPKVIIEVLSPSTERHDRGVKAQGYREIPSLDVLVLLAQDAPVAEIYERQGDGFWRLADIRGLDAVVELPAIGSRLPMAEIYGRALTQAKSVSDAGSAGRDAPGASAES